MNQLVPFKLLSSIPEIKRHCEFVIYNDPTYSVVQELGVNRHPYLVLYFFEGDKWNNLSINPEILYSSLYYMIDNMIHHKFARRTRKQFRSDKISMINDNAELRRTCNSEKTCFLALLNATPNKDALDEFSEVLRRVEILSVKSEYKDYNYGWVNITCHENLAKEFEFEKEKGGLIFYHTWKETYSKFPLPIDDYFLLNFFEKVKAGQFSSFELPKEKLRLEKNSCSAASNEKEKEQVKKDTKETKQQDLKKEIKTDL